MKFYEARDAVADSVGYSSLEAQSTELRYKLDAFIQRAQNWCYWSYDWENLRRVWQIATTAGISAYAWPTNSNGESIEPRKLVEVWLNNSGTVSELREGVPYGLRGSVPNAPPTRYWRSNQLNLWPSPDASTYTINLNGYMQLLSLVGDTDVLTLDAEPVIELAIAIAKYDLGKVDAQEYLALVNQLIAKLNQRNDLIGSVEPILTLQKSP